MIKAWSDAAWEDFEYWTKQDKKTLKRILQLLRDIDRNGYEGIGKPERLSGDLASYWSRRIDDANRIVYRIEDNMINLNYSRWRYQLWKNPYSYCVFNRFTFSLSR